MLLILLSRMLLDQLLSHLICCVGSGFHFPHYSSQGLTIGLFTLVYPLISVHIGRFATVGFTGQDLVEAFLPVSLHYQSLQMFLLPWIPTPPHLSHPHHHTNS